MKKYPAVSIMICLLCSMIIIPNAEAGEIPEPQIDWNPETYLCLKTDIPPIIDGLLNESAWESASWTDYFVDIEGDIKPAPRFKTRAKMLWDDEFFYICAYMEEPHVWATLTDRDSIIYYDNDFEVFIDPNKDTHLYYELECNAFSTEWDLLLVKPYRDGGPAIHNWDINGMKTAVHVDGTINDPSDRDYGWSIEIAIPWSVMREAAGTKCPPVDGDQWAVNFSRVEWKTSYEDGKYKKVINPETGKNYPEDNWVWSPQGIINMHYPEMWGIVEFAEKPDPDRKVEYSDLDRARWLLRKIYYAQKAFHEDHGYYALLWDRLNVDVEHPENWSWPPEIIPSNNRFEIGISNLEGIRMLITEDGKIHVREDRD